MKGITTTVQEIKTKGKDTGTEYSKYTTSIPNAIIEFGNLKKGDILIWTLEQGKIILEIQRSSSNTQHTQTN